MGDGEIFDGAQFVRTHPFTLDTTGAYKWRPGAWEKEPRAAQGYWERDDIAACHGLGFVYFTVISVHKPGRYPTRVFYSRHHVTPDNEVLPESGCLCVTMEKFNRLRKDFQVPYVVVGPSEEVTARLAEIKQIASGEMYA